MELADEITIPAPRAKVYDALNDVEILKACIPGCEELDKESDTELVAKVTLKVGPVKARFSGRVTLDRSKAPDSFSLAGEGDGVLPVLPRAVPMWNLSRTVKTPFFAMLPRLKQVVSLHSWAVV